MDNVFTESYLPKEILHRDDQLNEIRKIFDNFKKFGFGTNMIITGVTGSGKTTIIKKIIKERDNSIYINCLEYDSPVKALRSIFKTKSRDYSDVIADIKIKLKKTPKILVVDEPHRMSNYNRFIDALNFLYREFTFPIILVTNKRDFINTIHHDAKMTLNFERLSLPAYTASEIKDILNARLKIIKVNLPDMNNLFVSKLAAYSAKAGSCRTALSILQGCILSNTFTEESLDKFYKKLYDTDWGHFYNELNDTERKFLSALISCCDFKKECSSKDVSDKLQEFWSINITKGRTSQIMNLFADYSVIKSRHVNGHAQGRTRMVKFCSKEVYESLKIRVPH